MTIMIDNDHDEEAHVFVYIYYEYHTLFLPFFRRSNNAPFPVKLIHT